MLFFNRFKKHAVSPNFAPLSKQTRLQKTEHKKTTSKTNHQHFFQSTAISMMSAGIGLFFGIYLAQKSASALAIGVFILAGLFIIGGFFLISSILTHDRHEQETNDLEQIETRNEQLNQQLEALEDRSWEIKESEETHRSLAEAFDEVMIHRNQAGEVTFSNAPFDKYFKEPYRLPCYSFVHLNDKDKLQTVEIELNTAIGKQWFLWTDVVFRDLNSGEMGVRSVARNITAQKSAEQALRAALKKAEIANEAKTRFLATVSHEIRTPLNGVLGMAKLLKDTDLKPAQKNYVQNILSSGQTLLGLIEDLLDTVQVEAGHMALTPRTTNLVNLVEGVSEILSPRAREKGLILGSFIDPNIPQNIEVDAGRLRQILLNLAGNAVKFTHEGGVSIAVYQQKTASLAPDLTNDKVQLLFKVCDSGPGLAEKDQVDIFDEFHQLDNSATRRHNGVGLGLSISKRIVDLMGGKISVDSCLNEGAQFMFSLTAPVSKTAEEMASPFLETCMDQQENQVIAFIIPPSPARDALLQTARGSARDHGAYNKRTVHVFDDLAAFLENHDQLTALTHIIVQSCAHEPLQNLRQHVGDDVRLIQLCDAMQKISTIKADGWLTWPVRASTLNKVLAGDLLSEEKQHPSFLTQPVETADFQKEPEQKEQLPTLSSQQTALNILLAEDNAVNALLAKSLLNKFGHHVVHAFDGVEAFKIYQEQKFDLILMDLHMPNQDGLTTIKKIRAFEQTKNIAATSIAVLSADGQKQVRARVVKAGGDDFLLKPLDFSAVMQLLEKTTPAQENLTAPSH